MAMKVQFEIGHTARLRSKKTPEGFTHDWELYVRGMNEADISAYVEKVVFNLHDSFPKPKRVCNKPPYVITESGYAGFLLPIDIYFRNRDEPKRIQFTYDLDLQQIGPPHHRSEIQKFVFDHVTEDFRQKLLKGCGIPLAGAGMISGISTESPSTIKPQVFVSDESGGMIGKPKLSSGDVATGNGGGICNKKQKSRGEESKSNPFVNLFGMPIKSGSNKHTPDGKVGNSSNASDSKLSKTPGCSVEVSSVGGITTNVSQNSANMNITIGSKEKSSKERDKYSGGGTSTVSNVGSEKSREKSEKKDKHKSTISPHKESRHDSKKSANDGNKHEKSKKGKLRDKEREREKNASGGVRHTLSPKTARDSSAPSPRLQSPFRSSSTARGRGDEVHKPTAVSSSSTSKSESKESKPRQEKNLFSKRSKKEKKEKERDRDKERREEHKEKNRSSESKLKEERQGLTAATISANISAETLTTAFTGNNTSTEPKDLKDSKAQSNLNTKKIEKDGRDKIELGKVKGDKPASSSMNTNFSSIYAVDVTVSNGDKKLLSDSAINHEKVEKDKEREKEKKSHKHKKKDKSKEKDKERGDKERHRERERDKDKEKDKEKEHSKERLDEKIRPEKHPESNTKLNFSGKATNAPPDASPGNEAGPKNVAVLNMSGVTNNGNSSICCSAATSTTATAKKPQNKEKKSREKSSKEIKRSINAEVIEVEARNSSKHATKIADGESIPPTDLSTQAGSKNNSIHNNIVPLDVSQVNLPVESVAMTTATATTVATPTAVSPPVLSLQSDGPSSSFTDLQSKLTASSTTKKPTTSNVNKFEDGKTKKAATPLSAKEHKQRGNERNAETKDSAYKQNRRTTVKEEKKRRRNSVAADNTATNTFIEPPVKQAKKESHKTVRERKISPALRHIRAASISDPIGADNSNSNINGGRITDDPTEKDSKEHAKIKAMTTTADVSLSGDVDGGGSPSIGSSVINTGPDLAAVLTSSVTSTSSTIANPSNVSASIATTENPASITPAASAISAAVTLQQTSPARPSVTNAAAGMQNTNSGVTMPTSIFPTDYLNELQELHQKIMTLQDNDELQQVVEMIAVTGCYEITAKTFDFDLCKLDRSTVQRLQEFFATSVL